MATFSGLGIDNVLVSIDAQEVPILDGSAKPYVEAICKDGLVEQEAERKYLELKEKRRIEWEAEKERRANTFEDKTLVCKKCEKEWIWTASEQKFFKEKGFFRPSMCKECRSKIKVINNFHK